MSYLEYFPGYDPLSSDAPAQFNYPTYRSFAMAANYITFYAQYWGHYPTNYTTGFTRMIQADDPADVEAAFNELTSGDMAGKQGLGATSRTSIFCLSYSSSRLEDGTYGLSREDWRRAMAIAVATGNSSVVIWIDIVDRANRTHPWGDEQLCPYLIYPVIFVARAASKVKQDSLRLWPAIEATMGQLGAGLISDRIAQHCGQFIPFQARSRGLYYSVTVPEHPKIEREAFELHVASGRFRGCPTFHRGDYDRLLTVLQLMIRRWQDEDGDFFPALEKLEFRFSGMAKMKLEVTSTRWLTTELPRWTGRKEWLPQEGGMISFGYFSMQPSIIQGSYEIFVHDGWAYCIVDRTGKQTLLRMDWGESFDDLNNFRPEKLKPNAYARMPVGKGTAFLGNIVGVEQIAKMGHKYDLSKVEWQ